MKHSLTTEEIEALQKLKPDVILVTPLSSFIKNVNKILKKADPGPSKKTPFKKHRK